VLLRRYPYLLTSTASLELVREKSGLMSLAMARFRPNIVVDGQALRAFDEDAWAELRVGTGTKFALPNMCSRCKIPRLDPWTGVAHLTEPSATLRRYHAVGKQEMFGQNAVALNPGSSIRVGDPVSIVAKRKLLPNGTFQ
jgi:uncharacterized protein